MSLQQQSTTDAAAMAEQRAKAAGRRYRRQQSAFDILVIFVILQVISVIYGLIRPNIFAYNSPPTSRQHWRRFQSRWAFRHWA